MAGKTLYVDLVAQGKAQFAGNRDLFERFRSALTVFPGNFEIMPGTGATTSHAPPAIAPQSDPFKHEANPRTPQS